MIVEYDVYQNDIEGQSKMIQHHFVVFRTQGGFWYSLEKNSSVLEMRRSRDQSEVIKSYVGGYERPGGGGRKLVYRGEGVSYGIKRVKLGELLEFIKRELSRSYNVAISNCQDFSLALIRELGYRPTDLEIFLDLKDDNMFH